MFAECSALERPEQPSRSYVLALLVQPPQMIMLPSCIGLHEIPVSHHGLCF